MRGQGKVRGGRIAVGATAVVVAGVMAVTLMVTRAGPASAISSRCGRITCTTYFNRAETKLVADNATSANILLSRAGVPGRVTSGMASYVKQVAKHAVRTRQCLKIKAGGYFSAPGSGLSLAGVQTYAGGNCR